MANIKPYIIRLYVSLLSFFLFNKFLLRPFILGNDLPQFLSVFTLSVPNFIEAVMGTLVITGLIHMGKWRFGLFKAQSENMIYNIAVSLAGIYVITQEFKIHNLGGRNTFDPNDVIASVVGLFFTWTLMHMRGFWRKQLSEN